jgi:hypothetical protein
VKKIKPIVATTIRSIVYTHTLNQNASCCNEEKNTKYNKIIKGKSGKYRYIHKVHTHHRNIGATAWFCLDCPNHTSQRKGAIKSFF